MSKRAANNPSDPLVRRKLAIQEARASLAIGLKKGAKVRIQQWVIDEFSMPCGAWCPGFSPFYAIGIGPFWYVLFEGRQGRFPLVTYGWRRWRTFTFLERRRISVEISNRLTQLERRYPAAVIPLKGNA